MRVKRFSKAFFCISLLFVSAVIFSLVLSVKPAYAASAVKISKTKMTLCEGESKTLKITGSSKKVTWTSSNKKVAAVSSKGKVKALKPGTSTITAKAAGTKLKCKVSVYDDIGTYYCVWNVNRDLSPANRQLTEKEAAEVRCAINQLFNRSHIAQNIVGGVKPASTFVAMGITEPDGSQFYKHAGPKNAGYYKAKAQKSAALKTLGKYYTVSGGKVTDFPEIDYIFNSESEAHKTIAQYLQSCLKDVGIQMNLESYDWDTYQNVLGKGSFTLARTGWIADVNDANNFLEMNVAGNPINYCRFGTGKHASASVYTVKLKGIGKYKNLKGTWKQTYQKLISSVKKEKNEKIRNQLLHKAEDLLMDTGAVCPLYYFMR